METNKKRRKFSSEFKAQVALEALRERGTLREISVKYGVHVNQISKWKREFISNSSKLFELDSTPDRLLEKERDRLFRKVGELQMDNDYLKKNLWKTRV